MSHEPLATSRARLWTGLFAFLVTLIVGGTAALLLVDGFRGRAETSARRDALVIGSSVARTLAQQFERAARFNVPLKLIPGVDAYLAETLHGTPGIAQIVLRGADGREIRSAMGDTRGTDSTSAPVMVDGLQVASVEVATNPAALSTSFGHFRMKAMVAVALCAGLAGLAGAYLTGARLDQEYGRLADDLARAAEEDFEPSPLALKRAGHMPSGAVGRAFSALAQGNRRTLERRAVVEAYAEELLAVDFDGTLRPDVERVRREAITRPPSGEKERSL